MDEYINVQVGEQFVFTSPYDQYREHNGKTATLLGEVDRATIDYSETGPLYNIRFEDGTEIEAWPEEIDPSIMSAMVTGGSL